MKTMKLIATTALMACLAAGAYAGDCASDSNKGFTTCTKARLSSVEATASVLGLDLNVSGTGTAYAPSEVSGTLSAANALVAQTPTTGVAGTSTTMTLTVNGTPVGVAYFTSTTAATAGRPTTFTLSTTALISPGSVIGVTSGAGLTTSSTRPGDLSVRVSIDRTPVN